MPGFLDLVDAVNLLARVEAVVGALVHNARRSPKVRGSAALARCSRDTRVRYGEWSGIDVERFLRHYGVDVWGGRATTDHFIMYVKERQANWAEYLLRRRGIAIEGPVLDPKNLGYAQMHAPGDQPPPGPTGNRSVAACSIHFSISSTEATSRSANKNPPRFGAKGIAVPPKSARLSHEVVPSQRRLTVPAGAPYSHTIWGARSRGVFDGLR